jgi:hypothetical protein
MLTFLVRTRSSFFNGYEFQPSVGNLEKDTKKIYSDLEQKANQLMACAVSPLSLGIFEHSKNKKNKKKLFTAIDKWFNTE